jgi:ubiquinone/menaquinone biosynthesis C-methylase UbiE
MRNPWLDIPLADYESHMALPEIGQAHMLADELEFAVRRHSPNSLAVVGCSGGNGFDRLVGSMVHRIVGIDINAAYIEAARSRFALLIPRLELYVADVQSLPLNLEPVDMLFAALILEYVDAGMAIHSFKRLCRPGGALVVILQVAASNPVPVSPSPYQAIQSLAQVMWLLDPIYVQKIAGAVGFSLTSSRPVNLKSGKEFAVLSFQA